MKGALNAALMTVLLAGPSIRVHAVEVPVVVEEPAGLARVAQPATGGIPFAPGSAKDAGDLVLVDAVVSVAAGGKSGFTVKTGGGNPAPAKPLRIDETEDAIAFDTGAVTFRVGKKQFTLFDNTMSECSVRPLLRGRPGARPLLHVMGGPGKEG